MNTDKTYDKWLEERQQRRKGVIKLETLESEPVVVGSSKKNLTHITPYEMPDSLTPEIIPPSLHEIKEQKEEKSEKYRALRADYAPVETDALIAKAESAEVYKEFKVWGEYLNNLCSAIKSGEVPDALEAINASRTDLNELIQNEDAPKNLREGVYKLLENESFINNAFENALSYLDQQIPLDLAENTDKLRETLLLRYKNVQEAIKNIETFSLAYETLGEEALEAYDSLQKELGFNSLIEKDPLDVLQEILANALALLGEEVGNYQSIFFLEHIFLPLCEEQVFIEETIEKLKNNSDISEYIASNTQLNYYDDGTQELEVDESSHETIEQLMEDRDLETHDLIELIELENYPDELASKYMTPIENIYKKHLELINNVYINLIETIRQKVDNLVNEVTNFTEGYSF